MNNINITDIDQKIRQKFQLESENLAIYQQKLKSLQEIQDNKRLKINIKNNIQDLELKIQNIKERSEFNFYLSDSTPLLSEYQKILQKPMKMAFLGKPIVDDKEKMNVIKKYIKIASKHIVIVEQFDTPEMKCENCDGIDFDISDGNIYVCNECFAEKIIIKQCTTYNDTDRVNITPKYVYDRRIHFRDCINQYQGKQNSTIPQKIYTELEREFELHKLLNKNQNRKLRFSNITKNLVHMFLKYLGYTGHYENENLIYYNMTGNTPDDISYLEDKLMNDFDTLSALYDLRYKDTIERKNFINTQHILYQLLIKHKHKCYREDFSVLKTVDRRSFHDEVCEGLFGELQWNYIPFF
jgi:hypothetical protein